MPFRCFSNGSIQRIRMDEVFTLTAYILAEPRDGTVIKRFVTIYKDDEFELSDQ